MGLTFRELSQGEEGRPPIVVDAGMWKRHYFLAKEIFMEFFWVILKPCGAPGEPLHAP